MFDMVAKVLSLALEEPKNIPIEMMAALLECDDIGVWREIQSAAYEMKCRLIGNSVSLRGLVECSNICVKDCLYCGIRKSNLRVNRYAMTQEDVIDCCCKAQGWGYGSVALQSGEVESVANTEFFTDVLNEISSELGVTISLGEQTADVYQRWREAGALRYLLRIETSNPKLYAKLHPPSHRWQRRKDCLSVLRDLDYQVGTGVMIGLPGQTAVDLAADIAFFGEVDADMIGMGPWIPHPDAPIIASGWSADRALAMSLRILALARLYLWDVNMAATTALQALAEDGREQGLLHGANVIMPNITPVKYRSDYRLYENKPAIDENSLEFRQSLENSIASVGESIAYGRQGNSRHYLHRVGKR